MKKIILFLFLFALPASTIIWSGAQKEAVEAKGKVTVMCIQLKDEAIARFEEEFPEIELEPQVRPFPDIFNHIQVAMQAGSTEPDVMEVDAPLVHQYSYQGWLAPLDDLIPKDLLNEHDEAEVKSGMYQGKLMAAPWSIATVLVFYNKDMFREAGLALPPKIPESPTWEEIVPMAQKLIKKDASGNVETWGFVIEQRDRPYEVFNLIGSLGGKYIADDGLTVKGVMDSEPWVKAFEFYRDFYTKWKLAPNTDYPWTVTMLIEKKAAMVTSGPWACATIFQTDFDFDMGTTAFPHFEGGKIVNNCGGWHWGINSNSRNKKAAAEFIKWNIRPEIDHWLWETGYEDVGLPSAKSILKKIQTDPKYADYPQRVSRDFATIAGKGAIPRALTPGYLEYETIFIREAANIRQGKEVSQALADAITDIEKEMDKYR